MPPSHRRPRGKGLVCLLRRDAGCLRDDRALPGTELLVRRRDVDHQVPDVLPRRIIEIVETMFRTSFWAVPAFSRVEPAIISAPTGDADLVVGDGGELGARDADDAARQRSAARAASSAARRRAIGRSR